MDEFQSSWLTFSDGMVGAWDDQTSSLLTLICRAEVRVTLSLPTENDARFAWENNIDLLGALKLEGAIAGEVEIPLPFDGVFLARNAMSNRPNRLVWDNCLVEKMGVRLVRPVPSEKKARPNFWRIGLPNGNHLDFPIDGKINEGSKSWKKAANRLLRSMGELAFAQQAYSEAYPEWLRKVLFGEEMLKPTKRARSYSQDERRRFSNLCWAINDKKDELKAFDWDDLGHRVVWSFPRWLQHRLCRRLHIWNMGGRKMGCSLSDALYGLVPLIGKGLLDDTAGDLVYVLPENPVELMSRIHGVKRFHVSRSAAERFPETYRQNHPSFNRRICPIETPESEMVGISLQLARGACVDENGCIIEALPDLPLNGRNVGGCQSFVSWGTSLIPFFHHNDDARNMMGAKNLRQAVLVDGREPPLVESGGEAELVRRMKPLMRVGICPGEYGKVADELALGCNLLVAYMPWYGWNVDDAIVVSEDVCRRMSVRKVKTFTRFLKEGWTVEDEEWVAAEERTVHNGDLIVALIGPKGGRREIRYVDTAEARVRVTVSKVDCDKALCRLHYELIREMPLGIGDKLMGRHGNKGVVAKILSSKEMPKLPDGRHVEVLLNPHGILSRMNPSQLLETHLGWVAKNCGAIEDLVLSGRKPGYPEKDIVNHAAVRERLRDDRLGMDDRGCAKLIWRDPVTFEEVSSEEPIVVGYQYIVRLNHIPELKAQARRGGIKANYDLKSGQAAHGRAVGGGQRVGEMEFWGLRAHAADAVIAEMVGKKSDVRIAKCRGEDILSPYMRPRWFTGCFGGYFRAWMRGLCIDVEEENDDLVLRRLPCQTGEELVKALGGKAQDVGERAKGKQCVVKARFVCGNENCDGAGDFFAEHVFDRIVCNQKGKKAYLTLDRLLAEFGFKLADLPRFQDGVGEQRVVRNGDKSVSGKLQLEFRETKGCQISVSSGELPTPWPGELSLFTCLYDGKVNGKRLNQEDVVRALENKKV